MKTFFLMVICLILFGCGGDSKKSQTNEPNPTDDRDNDSFGQVKDGVLVLKSEILKIEDTYEPGVLPNRVYPGNVTDIRSISKDFLFSSGESSVFYLSHKSIYGFCSSPYSRPTFSIKEGEDEFLISENQHIELKQNTDYILVFNINSLDCVSSGYAAEFSFSRVN